MQTFDVILLTETRSAMWDDSVLPDHSVAFIPASRDGQAGEGILVATRRNRLYQVLDWASDDSTLCVKLNVQGSCKPIILGCCYIPPSGSPQLHSFDLTARLTSMTAMVAAAVSEGDVLLAGDFNARVAQLCECDDVAYTFRGCSDTTVTVHGRSLIEACKQSGLLLCTGRAPGDELAVPTFKARSRTQASRPDHVLVSRGLLPNIKASKDRPATAHSGTPK